MGPHNNLKNALIREFFKLKNELLETMEPKQAIRLWQDTEGNSITLRGDDRLLSKFQRIVRITLSPCDPQDMVLSYRDQIQRGLTEEVCLAMAVERFKEILLLRKTGNTKSEIRA